jgi:hypothetical protein
MTSSSSSARWLMHFSTSHSNNCFMCSTREATAAWRSCASCTGPIEPNPTCSSQKASASLVSFTFMRASNKMTGWLASHLHSRPNPCTRMRMPSRTSLTYKLLPSWMTSLSLGAMLMHFRSSIVCSSPTHYIITILDLTFQNAKHSS